MSHNLKINGIEFSPVDKISIPNTDGDEIEFIDKSKVTHFATGYVNNVTAGQAITVTGITDEKTGEAFDIKGLIGYIQPSSSVNVYPVGHASGKPAVFCFVRDYLRGFGLAMAGHADSQSVSYLRQVRLNTTVGSSDDGSQTITVDGNSFTYKSRTDDMWGLIAASQWRWVAWD